MADRKTRLSVIIVSANSAKWLRPCLTTVYERAGDVELDVVVVAAGCTDETVPLVERHFPQARTISCPNRGFAFANNRALRTVDADWVLFLNPDTEILEGSFADLIDTLGPRSTEGSSASARSPRTASCFRRFAASRTRSGFCSRRSAQSASRFGRHGSGSASSTSASTSGT